MKEKQPLRILELFGGIGAFSAALDRLAIPYTITDYIEIDKYAVQSYNAIHGTQFEPQDITQWDKDVDVDFIMHGSPCQDFSIAGLQAGGDKDSGTRSSLMYETVRIVQKLKPKYVLWENVANMLSDKHRHNFDAYWEAMESFGYHNASYTLNAKDYGIPQNRVRIFTLSVLNEYWKDEYFIPPKGKKLEKCLADILEQNVEEKYYLSDKLVQSLLKHKEKHKAQGHGFGCEIKDVYQDIANPIICGGMGLEKNLIPKPLSPTISARYYKDGSDCLLRVHQIGNLFQYKRENPSAGRVYDQNGLSPTLTNMQGGHRQPYIVENMPKIAAMRGRYVEPVIGRSVGRNPDDPSRRVAGDPTEQRLEINAKGLCNTLTSVQKDNLVVEPKMTSGSDIAGCIRSSIYKQGSRNLIENILHKRGYEGVLEPVGLPVVNATKQGYEMAYPGDSVNLNYPDSKTRRGRVGKGCAQTLTCSDSMGVVVDNISLYDTQYRIRKLTPRECWRLMGFQDEEFEKAQAVCSNTQLYKQAGNSIVVDVLVALLKEIFSYELKGKLETF
ncbi:DNA (cytosine-5-)-methyltransferase [Faecalicoccus pleomorphus]|uniref:DNA (cytosine-5-)-methyltransferase n=1 Tax=Faecalicoccus pleomorphus TaxID=1323 RepID=UPI002941E81B|nr:DNA (cytosine-5-)-methyltransferase [Faecalicoccus pleomorphus]